MKYFSIGCGILAILLAAGIWSSLWIDRSVENVQTQLEAAVDALDTAGIEAAVAHSALASVQWERHRRLLGILLSHERLEEISVGFAELSSYAGSGDGEEYRACCQALLVRLASLAKTDLPLYDNLL